MGLNIEVIDILLNNSHRKQLSEKDSCYELTLAQYENMVYELKVYYGVVTDRDINHIKGIVLRYFHQKEKDVLSKSRKQIYVKPRQFIAYLLRKYTKKSFAKIGAVINKDHVTVQMGIDTLKDLIETDNKLRDDMKTIEKRINLPIINNMKDG